MCVSDQSGCQLYPLGLLVALLPLLTTHLCLLLNFSQETLAWCNPYWLDCHSISATGRQGVAYFVFKGGMLPAMLLLALYWWLNQYWLRHLFTHKVFAIGWLGSLASVALSVYTLSLGHDGDIPYLLRRTGVVTYLGLTFICQLILAATLSQSPLTRSTGRHLLTLSTLTLVLALLSLALDASMGEGYERIENAVEWSLILLLNLHVLLSVRLWKRLGVRMTLQHQ